MNKSLLPTKRIFNNCIPVRSSIYNWTSEFTILKDWSWKWYYHTEKDSDLWFEAQNAQWNKLGIEKQILCDLISMWNIKKKKSSRKLVHCQGLGPRESGERLVKGQKLPVIGQVSFRDLISSKVTTVNNICIICLEVAKRVDLKCSYHKKKNCNYMNWWMC